MRTSSRLLTLFAATLLIVSGLPSVPASDGEDTLHVCQEGCEYATIQAAVDAADPGATVHVAPGTYTPTEPIEVETRNLVIEGKAPGLTIVDAGGIETEEGHDHGAGNGFYVTANEVRIQDLTVQEAPNDGVLFEGVTGFYAENVHVVDNGVYGLNAYASKIGGFFDSYGTGHSDAAFYIGEILSCQCVVENVTAEGNLIGYSGTGASHVTIKDSTFTDNAAGIVPNVLVNDHHHRPADHVYIYDNTITANNNETAMWAWQFSDVAHVPFGLGVVLAGATNSLVAENTITDHARAGVAIAWLHAQPSFNEVVRNDVANGAPDAEPAPLEPEAVDIVWDGGGVNNCFEDNQRVDEGTGVTFDAGAVWNTAGTLPDCDTPNASPPMPGQVARVASLLATGCEPGDVLLSGDSCSTPGT